MGTRFELVLVGRDERRLRAAGEEAIEIILEQHQRLSAFDRSSLLSHVNESAAKRPAAVDGEFFELLALCRDVWRASGGAFDPSVGLLMQAWGFRGGEPADDAEIARAAESCGFGGVELDAERSTVAFARPGMRLDLASIAKGFALDLAAERLRELSVRSALLHGGTSSVLAIGTDPAGEPWRIAIGEGGPIVPLADAALGVSAPHGREVIRDGQRLGHVLDPRLGRPAIGPAQAAVVSHSAALADAWSTALLVLGAAPEGFEHAAAIQSVALEWTFTPAWPPANDARSGRRAAAGREATDGD